MAAVLPLAEIPAVSLLYKLKKLAPPTSAAPVRPDQTLNNKISIIRHDLTKLDVDAIVNAANTSLLGGGGVDGAIHRAAGRGLLEECRALNGCKTGEAKITKGHNLPARHVIHTVGPVYSNASKSEPLLRGCYKTSLQLAVENGCKSIAFSAISTGVYGYPSGAAAEAALSEVRDFLIEEQGKKLDRVIFCQFESKDVNAYEKSIPKYFPPTEADLSSYGGSTESQSESLAAALPDPPTTEPLEPGQPMAKKLKVETNTKDDIDEDWEKVAKVDELETERDDITGATSEEAPLDETKATTAKGEVENMLAKDW
ncbi:putative lrp16 family protein [Phaeomoniella chlamydospora]|uniref:Putative lrp16 family protein n=1 Tax=Phaeomoniella chlamydospora TaxID=158046 RepID=A0A0G2EHP5_PHACM|nr:putative lrp16 family protein [Phaeomoniella chlamydospora]